MPAGIFVQSGSHAGVRRFARPQMCAIDAGAKVGKMGRSGVRSRVSPAFSRRLGQGQANAAPRSGERQQSRRPVHRRRVRARRRYSERAIRTADGVRGSSAPAIYILPPAGVAIASRNVRTAGGRRRRSQPAMFTTGRGGAVANPNCSYCGSRATPQRGRRPITAR